MEELRVGPAVVLVASSLDTDPEAWVNCGATRGDIVVRVGSLGLGVGRVDQAGAAPLANLLWRTGPEVTLQVPMLEHDLQVMAQWFPGALLLEQASRKALGIAVTGRVSPVSWAVVPVVEFHGTTPWVDAAHALWIPRGVVTDVNPLATHTMPDTDAAEGATYAVTVRALGGPSTLEAASILFYGPRSAVLA